MASSSRFKDEIQVSIFDLESIVYQGKIKALTSINEKGKFDILPMHSNFISIVKDYIILHERQGSQKEFKLRRGVLRLVNNQISIFIGLEARSQKRHPNPCHLPTAIPPRESEV